MLLLGDIDLSVGSTIALIGTLLRLGLHGEFHLFYWSHYPYCSTGSGDDKWWLDGYSGDPSFIVTVATMGIFRGIAYIVTMVCPS